MRPAHLDTTMEPQIGREGRLIVVGLCVLMATLTLAALPLANLQFDKIPAVVPFLAALVVATDGLTAILLLIQNAQLRQPQRLLLSGAYFFCAFIALAQFLTFPDVFPANAAIPQVSPWLWTLWHFGFPLAIFGYLVMNDRCSGGRIEDFALASNLMMIGIAIAVGALSFWLILNHEALPVFFFAGDKDMTQLSWRNWTLVANLALILAVSASLMLSPSRRTKLHFYLLLSLIALACEVFSVIFIHSRYTLYWFFARFDGVVASSAVLLMFLLDNARLYRDLLDLNRTLEHRVTERTAQVSTALDERERALEHQSLTEAAWRKSEERFRAAQEASLDGFIIFEPILDSGGRITDLQVIYANPVAAQYCLSTPEAMIGHPISEIIPSVREASDLIERHGSVLTTGRPLEYVLDYQADGISGHFLNMVVPFGDHLAATFRDITTSVRQREELEEAKVAAEEANRAKSRFLATISHDLRQPMMALRLLVHTATLRTEAPEQADILARIGETLDSTETMLSRLMDLAALELGKAPVKREVFRLDSHLAAIVGESSDQAETKGLLLRLWTFPCWADSDPMLLDNILRNLVVNAVRYTEHGSVLVAIRRRGERLRIEVRDSGRGIPWADQQLVFEEFRQLDNPERNRNKGQGLGLAIVARTVERLGHPLFLRSAAGRGSVFAIEVPAAAMPNQSETVAEAPSFPPQPMSSARILILEDDPIQASALGEILTNCGHHVTIAHDYSTDTAQL